MNSTLQRPVTAQGADTASGPIGALAARVGRLRNRIAGVFVTLAMLIGVPVGAASATAPAPPAVGDTAKVAAGQLSNGLVDGFVAILPYVIPVLVIFTVVGYVWKMLAARKKAH